MKLTQLFICAEASPCESLLFLRNPTPFSRFSAKQSKTRSGQIIQHCLCRVSDNLTCKGVNGLFLPPERVTCCLHLHPVKLSRRKRDGEKHIVIVVCLCLWQECTNFQDIRGASGFSEGNSSSIQSALCDHRFIDSC